MVTVAVQVARKTITIAYCSSTLCGGLKEEIKHLSRKLQKVITYYGTLVQTSTWLLVIW